MNTQLVESVIQLIRSLSPEEKAIDEPDLYSLTDGEPIPCL
jgi:hypothetical protein